MTTHTANSRWLQFSADDEYEPAPDISPSGMAIAAVPVLCVFILSAALRLGNVQTLIIATIRCVALGVAFNSEKRAFLWTLFLVCAVLPTMSKS